MLSKHSKLNLYWLKQLFYTKLSLSKIGRQQKLN